MADEADIGRLFETAERELGPVSGIVCNAGITGRITRVEDMSTAAIREIMDLNVVGLMIANREAVRRMSTKRGGSGGAVVRSEGRRVGKAWVRRDRSRWSAYH